MAQFSLTWDAYKQNICNGLSALQQNGEFVDMTIAADGHHVKVHQMVLSLVSPYIKELITSAKCPHPVIFLNKISYPILCAILEYIYTGEVMVEKENLNELVQTAKELHIKGLEDMKLELSTQQSLSSQAVQAKYNEGQPLSEKTGFFRNVDYKVDNSTTEFTIRRPIKERKRSVQETDESYVDDAHIDDSYDHAYGDSDYGEPVPNTSKRIKVAPDDTNVTTHIQYTLSNQGSLQMILNRYMYNLRYTSRKNGHRSWCCVEKRDKKCPATVVTNNDIVIHRSSAHCHKFHDHKILKKVRDNAVYSALSEAEVIGHTKKMQKQSSNSGTDSIIITNTVGAAPMSPSCVT